MDDHLETRARMYRHAKARISEALYEHEHATLHEWIDRLCKEGTFTPAQANRLNRSLRRKGIYTPPVYPDHDQEPTP